jgi:hypothetical protein
LEYIENLSLDLMVLMCMSLLCVLMYTQIEEEFNLYSVGQMVSLKYILSSPKHESRMDGFLGFSRCFTIILGVIGLL